DTYTLSLHDALPILLICTNAGFGTLPVSNSFVRPFAELVGANTACAVRYDCTAAIAALRSRSAARPPKKRSSTSLSSIALSMKRSEEHTSELQSREK